MRRVLVLRPEPGASATVGRARALGLDAIAMPLFEIEPIEWEAPDPADFDGLLLTSANAVRHGGAQLERLLALPVYAVGQATADTASAAGFEVIAEGEAGVDQLLGSVQPDLKLLHLCGEDRHQPAEASQPIVSLPVYRARELTAPDLSIARGAVVLIHSPRAGRRFAELAQDRASVAIAAISPVAADAVGTGWATVAAADRPADEALLALAARLCNKPAPQ